jgi:acetyl-CoA carboxylase biotin carboxyl carrier protein
MSENTAMAKAEEREPGGSRKKNTSKTSGSTGPSFNMDELRDLAELVNEHGFTDFEFENANIRVRLSKMTAAPVVQAYAPAPVAQAAPVAATATKPEAEKTTAAPAEPDADLYKITSPIVGTFYRSPGPDKEAYVKEGSKVSEDSVVCIVEAMKLMNEIQAEVTGEVVKIYVENGQPVEYGQPLFGIKK